MKKLKIIMAALLAFALTASVFAQDVQTKTLYRTGIYGQTFELMEVSNDQGCVLCLVMADNKNTNKSSVTFYDAQLPTTFYIFSKLFATPREYSKAIDSCKTFFDKTMVLVYLADMKDICDIAPCCRLEGYGVQQSEHGEKYIEIQYACSDLEKLFEIAGIYAGYGREYVLEKYLN